MVVVVVGRVEGWNKRKDKELTSWDNSVVIVGGGGGGRGCKRDKW